MQEVNIVQVLIIIALARCQPIVKRCFALQRSIALSHPIRRRLLMSGTLNCHTKLTEQRCRLTSYCFAPVQSLAHDRPPKEE